MNKFTKFKWNIILTRKDKLAFLDWQDFEADKVKYIFPVPCSIDPVQYEMDHRSKDWEGKHIHSTIAWKYSLLWFYLLPYLLIIGLKNKIVYRWQNRKWKDYEPVVL